MDSTSKKATRRTKRRTRKILILVAEAKKKLFFNARVSDIKIWNRKYIISCRTLNYQVYFSVV